MKKEELSQGLKAAFFILSGALLVSFGLVTLIEGIMIQLARDSLTSLVFYFISMCSFGATIWTYFEAKRTLSTLY